MKKDRLLISVLSLLFFLSGGAGLIYQVAWQRALNIAFGSNLESVTIIVSAFMLGLGLGALIGGKLADHFQERNLIGLFCLCEVGIGIFGLISFNLILIVGEIFVTKSLFIIALANFLVILFPALLMGATLPILITFMTKKWSNIGRSTGHLYAINTLGAALGAYLTGFILFNYFELDVVIILAAMINLSVAGGTYYLFKKVMI